MTQRASTEDHTRDHVATEAQCFHAPMSLIQLISQSAENFRGGTLTPFFAIPWAADTASSFSKGGIHHET